MQNNIEFDSIIWKVIQTWRRSLQIEWMDTNWTLTVKMFERIKSIVIVRLDSNLTTIGPLLYKWVFIDLLNERISKEKLEGFNLLLIACNSCPLLGLRGSYNKTTGLLSIKCWLQTCYLFCFCLVFDLWAVDPFLIALESRQD
jgi:hypothetical protein